MINVSFESLKRSVKGCQIPKHKISKNFIKQWIHPMIQLQNCVSVKNFFQQNFIIKNMIGCFPRFYARKNLISS